MKILKYAAIAFLICGANAWAGADLLRFDNPEHERRYQTLIKELRCLVCQNQNLADSNADLATDLREKVYQMIQAGSSDDDIVDYMVDRYGDFVLYRPPVNTATILLWAGPFLILCIAVLGVITFIRRRNVTGTTLDPDHHAQAQRLLKGD